VIYLARADVIRELGAWGTEYEVASGEDVDLAFKVWVNELDIVYDQRVLVEHISKGTASRLDDWQDLWARNRRRFLDKWSGDTPIPRLETCPPERHARNRAIAASVAEWMDRYFTLRDRGDAGGGRPRRTLTPSERVLRRGRLAWRRVQHRVPPDLARKMGRTFRQLTRGR
jgi:hypothetical protein